MTRIHLFYFWEENFSMAIYDGVTLAAGKNLFIATSADVCDICLNDEKAKNKDKAFYELRLQQQGRLIGKKIAKVPGSNGIVTICEDCIKDMCKELIIEETHNELMIPIPEPEAQKEMIVKKEEAEEQSEGKKRGRPAQR